MRIAVVAALFIGCSAPGSVDENRPRAARSALTSPSPFEETKLKGSDPTNNHLGTWVSANGDTIIAGDPGSNLSQAGTARVFVRSGTTWSEQAKLSLTPSQTSFGGPVAISGDTALVASASSTYVFVRSANIWTQETTLPAVSPYSGIALDQDTALVGSTIFTRSGTTWSPQPPLLSTAHAVALRGDTALIVTDSSNPGEDVVKVFVRNGTTWTEQDELQGDGSAKLFGYSVAIYGDTAIVGAMGTTLTVGAAFVFARSGTTWSQQGKFAPNPPVFSDSFALSVAVRGNVALVGAPRDSKGGLEQGSVHIFVRRGAEWSEDIEITASEKAYRFGWSVAILDDAFVVGSQGNAIYVYRRLPAGTSCSVAITCASGFCADGVCCDAECGEKCLACVAAKTGQPDGKCAPISAGTDPDSDCSDDGAPACTQDGLCDGAGKCETYAGPNCTPTSCTLDKECTSDHCAKETGKQAGICCNSACDGPCSSCLASNQSPGGKDGVCGTTSECAPATCDGDHTTTTAEGVKTDCTPYKCQTNGTCLQTCSSVLDCAKGNFCNPSHNCVPAANEPASDDGGCGCRSQGASRSLAGPSWTALIAAIGLMRRRRR